MLPLMPMPPLLHYALASMLPFSFRHDADITPLLMPLFGCMSPFATP